MIQQSNIHLCTSIHQQIHQYPIYQFINILNITMSVNIGITKEGLVANLIKIQQLKVILYIQQMSNKVLKKEFYNIEKILDRRGSANGSFEYLVKWKNYAHKFNTWEPIGHLFPVRSLVERFNESYQIRIKAEKFRNSNNCLACSNNNKNCKSRTNNMFENPNKREKLFQVKMHQFLKSPSLPKQHHSLYPQTSSFQYRLAHKHELPQHTFSHSPKKQQKTAQSTLPYHNTLSDNFVSNNLHPANLFLSSNSHLKENILFDEDIEPNYINSFQESSPMIGQLDLEQRDIDSQQIFKIDIIPEEVSQPILKYNKQQIDADQKMEHFNNQPEEHGKESQQIGKEGKQKKSMQDPNDKPNQYLSNDCTVLTEKQKSNEISGGSQKSQKIKENNELQQEQEQQRNERQRSRIKRRQYRFLQELKNSHFTCPDNKKRRQKPKDQFVGIKPKIRITQIPQPTPIHQQLKQFDNKRICEMAYEAQDHTRQLIPRNRVVLKMQNANKQIVKLELQQIQNNHPRWLKDYFQSYI